MDGFINSKVKLLQATASSKSVRFNSEHSGREKVLIGPKTVSAQLIRSLHLTNVAGKRVCVGDLIGELLLYFCATSGDPSVGLTSIYGLNWYQECVGPELLARFSLVLETQIN